MNLDIVAKTSLDDVVVDFIGVRLKSGEEVSLNWDESGISRMQNGFEAGYLGVCFDEDYADGRIDELEGFEITDYQLYSEKYDKEYTRKQVESGVAGFEFEIVQMKFEDDDKKLSIINPPVAVSASKVNEKSSGLDTQIEAASAIADEAKHLRAAEKGKGVIGYARYFCGEFDGTVISVEEYQNMERPEGRDNDTVEYAPIFDGKIYDTLSESTAAQIKTFGKQIDFKCR